jgi:glutaredoxin
MASEFKGRIVVFSIPTCRYCKQSKAILNSFSVPFHDVNLEKHPERRAESQERTGRRTVPQIFFNDVHIGGFDELKKLYDEGKLEDLLKEIADTEAPPTAPLPSPDEDIVDQSSLDMDSGRLSEVVSGRLSEVVSGRSSEVVSGRSSEVVSGRVSEVVSGRSSEVVSGC